MNEIERLTAATEATEKRFKDRPFDWSKQATCVHLMRFHAQQLGHKLPIVPRFRSPLGAKKALKKMGHDDLISLLDELFTPVPAAFTRVGDIIAIPGDAGFHALLIRGGVTKFLGWHEHAEGCTIIECGLDVAVGAWRL